MSFPALPWGLASGGDVCEKSDLARLRTRYPTTVVGLDARERQFDEGVALIPRVSFPPVPLGLAYGSDVCENAVLARLRTTYFTTALGLDAERANLMRAWRWFRECLSLPCHVD